MDLKSCGWCCGGFSTFAIIFLCVVAAVINSGSTVIKLDTTKTTPSAAVRNLLIAAGIYAGFLLLSIGCIFYRPKSTAEQDVKAVEASDVNRKT